MTERLSYTVRETALALGVSPDTVYRLIDRGELPAVQCGRRKLIARSALERYLNPSHHSEVVAQAVFT